MAAASAHGPSSRTKIRQLLDVVALGEANLHAAPAQQAAPAFTAPAPAEFRLQNTPAKWFEQSAQAHPAQADVTPLRFAPHFTREGVVPFYTLHPRMLAPGTIATIYGSDSQGAS